MFESVTVGGASHLWKLAAVLAVSANVLSAQEPCARCHSGPPAAANASPCQSCHTGTATRNSGEIVYTSAFSNGTAARVAADNTFAIKPETTYLSSKGHGGLPCGACHGSKHAEFAKAGGSSLEGHASITGECNSCHDPVPSTVTGGPHGLHPVGMAWISSHQRVAEVSSAACQVCHGADYRGTILSRTLAERSLGAKVFPKGTIIGCYSCHKGPNGG